MVQGSRGRTVGCMGRKLCVSQTYTEAPAELWVDRKPAIPSALENGFCVHHNKKAFLPRGGEEAARLAGSNPSLKGSSVPGPGILDSQNEEGWGWVGVQSLSHSSSASGGPGRAGVCQIGLPRSDPSMVLPSCMALAKSLPLRDPFSSRINCEREHPGWSGSQSHADRASGRFMEPESGQVRLLQPRLGGRREPWAPEAAALSVIDK